ncbi:hypothetical protein DWW11_05805, partial [Bifidobacterium longum]
HTDNEVQQNVTTPNPQQLIEHKQVVPPKRNRTAPWDYDREAYKGRNMVERVFNRMKHHRKAATRYDRLDETFLANLQLIPIAVYLKKHSQKPNQCKHTPVKRLPAQQQREAFW